MKFKSETYKKLSICLLVFGLFALFENIFLNFSHTIDAKII